MKTILETSDEMPSIFFSTNLLFFFFFLDMDPKEREYKSEIQNTHYLVLLYLQKPLNFTLLKLL